DGLGIPLDFRVDPMTVVARGAAIYAGTQRLPRAALPPVEMGTYALEVDYKPVGTDPEPLVGGRVVGTAGQRFTDFTIEFVKTAERSPWRSGRVEVQADGRFLAGLW